MAAKEKVESRSMHFTMQGQTITQVWVGTWNDVANAGTSGIPVIGTPWSIWRQDLCVSDIQVTPLPNNNTHAQAVCTYSTSGNWWPERIPETIASTKLLFDFQLTPGISDAYYDYTLGKIESWETIYSAWYLATYSVAAPTIPPRVREASTIVMTISANVRRWNWNDTVLSLGKINSDVFLPIWSDRYVIAPDGTSVPMDVIDIGDRLSFNDIGQWLFAGCRVENIGRSPATSRFPNYEITSTFLWEMGGSSSKGGWNRIYDVTGYTAYQSTNFFSMLPRPTEHGVSINMDLRQ